MTGIKTVGKNIENAKIKLNDNMKKEMITTALVNIETPAKKKCHVKTGRLRASIHTEYMGNKGYSYKNNIGNSFNGALSVKLDKDDVVVGTNVEYATKMEALDPYLFPAFENAKPILRKRLKEAVKKI